MNIEKMLNNLTPEQLEAGLTKLSGVLSSEQMKQVKSVLQNTNKEELSNKLKDVDVDSLRKNPEFDKFFENK